VQQHLSEDISLEEIARAAGLSPFHFSRSFKKTTGLSPYRFLTEQRILRAQRMLMESDTPVAQIALACGFGGQQQFTTTFRKIMGSTPARFRRENRP
jgi:AraC family transcriptional regulator